MQTRVLIKYLLVLIYGMFVGYTTNNLLIDIILIPVMFTLGFCIGGLKNDRRNRTKGKEKG